MNGKELYEKYQGKEAKYVGTTGIIVGHDQSSLIMAVIEGMNGWKAERFDTIYTMENNSKGYLYVDEQNVTK